MRIFLIIFLVFTSNQVIDDLFQKSNDYYTNGDYQNAVNGYLDVLDSGFESAELYFNLGNSFYKLNNIPDSNFYYEKAKSISPNDDDILTNLIFEVIKIEKIKQDKLNLKIEKKIKNFSNNDAINKISLQIDAEKEIIIISKDSKLKRLYFTTSIVFIILSSLTLFINFEKKKLSEIKYAIVYDKEIEVWSEPNNISELKFLLHEGTKVKQLDVIEDWVNIQLENGTLGWIQSSSLRVLD